MDCRFWNRNRRIRKSTFFMMTRPPPLTNNCAKIIFSNFNSSVSIRPRMMCRLDGTRTLTSNPDTNCVRDATNRCNIQLTNRANNGLFLTTVGAVASSPKTEYVSGGMINFSMLSASDATRRILVMVPAVLRAAPTSPSVDRIVGFANRRDEKRCTLIQLRVDSKLSTTGPDCHTKNRTTTDNRANFMVCRYCRLLPYWLPVR